MTVALATSQPPPLAMPSNPFEPQNIPQAMELANAIAKSGLVPSALRGKPADVLIILMTARELGIGPMQALSDINVIQGKPVLSADLMVSQCKRKTSRCEYFILVESTDDHATYEAKAVGAPAPERYTFNLENARGLHLLDKDNWKKQPKTMLRRRAAAACAREVFPDLVRGYDPDEAEDFGRRPAPHAAPVPPSEPAPAPEAAPPTVDVTPPADAPPVTVDDPPTVTEPPTVALWTKLVPEFGGDKVAAGEALRKAMDTHFGVTIPLKKDWTQNDCDQLYRIATDIPF